MTPTLRNKNAKDAEQERLNQISLELKEMFKTIFAAEKEANSKICVNNTFSTDLQGRKLKWMNDTTVFLNELNKIFECFKLEIGDYMSEIAILKEKLDSEIYSASENLKANMAGQIDTMFDEQKLAFEDKFIKIIDEKITDKIKLVEENFIIQKRVLIEENVNLNKQVEELKNKCETLNEKNERLEARIESNKTLYEKDLQFVTHKYDELEKEFNKFNEKSDRLFRRANVASGAGLNSLTQRNVNLKVPVFHGSGQPLKLLKELKTYFENLNVDFDEGKVVLRQALQNTAKDWWHINEEKIGSWEDFEDYFKDHFWSLAAQDRIRARLDQGKYEGNGSLSKSDYAMKIYALAHDLGYSEVEIIRKLSSHFDSETRFSIRTRQISTQVNLIKL